MRDSESTLLRLFYCLKKVLQAHCKAALAILEDSQTHADLLAMYCSLWTAYSASTHHLDADFKRFIDLINEVYEAKWPNTPQQPKFSMVRFTTLIWRRAVFDHLEAALLAAAQELLALARVKRTIEVTQVDLWARMRLFVSALVDLSVDEHLVHYLGHSQVRLSRPYLLLDEIVVKHYTEAVGQWTGSAQLCWERSEWELRLSQLMFLPVTYRKIERLIAEKEMKMWESLYGNMYRREGNSPLRPNSTQSEFVNSAFGCFLFSLSYQYPKSHVRQFIDHLVSQSEESIRHISRYNELAEVCSVHTHVLEDEYIEVRVRHQLGDILASKPNKFSSIAQDLTRKDFECIGKLLDCIA